MASISSVDLKIFPNNPSVGQAYVQVSYTITNTADDLPAERSYRELVQLFSEGKVFGGGGVVEQPVPNGTMWDGVVVFTAAGFDRGRERYLPLADLQQGGVGILARVTLTPLPPAAPSRDSNLVRVLVRPLSRLPKKPKKRGGSQ
jgi:hypothetical protein